MTISYEAILNDSAASDWLKLALVSALERDPGEAPRLQRLEDAAADAEVLAAVLRELCDAVLFDSESVGNLLDALQDELRRDGGDDRG